MGLLDNEPSYPRRLTELHNLFEADVVQRLSDPAMPGLHDSSTYWDQCRTTTYLTQMGSLFTTGHLSAKERRALLRL